MEDGHILNYAHVSNLNIIINESKMKMKLLYLNFFWHLMQLMMKLPLLCLKTMMVPALPPPLLSSIMVRVTCHQLSMVLCYFEMMFWPLVWPLLPKAFFDAELVAEAAGKAISLAISLPQAKLKRLQHYRHCFEKGSASKLIETISAWLMQLKQQLTPKDASSNQILMAPAGGLKAICCTRSSTL